MKISQNRIILCVYEINKSKYWKRAYYAAVNHRLSIIYEAVDFYIAEDYTFQPWLSIMGHIPHNMTEQELGDLLLPYVENENNKVNILTYHEYFIIGLVQKNFRGRQK